MSNEGSRAWSSGPDTTDAGQSPARVRTDSQAGFSLVEALVAILLTTVVIVGIASGIITTLKTTQTVSETQRREAALTDATEAIKGMQFVPCADVGTYRVSGATVQAVQYLDPDPAANGTRFVDPPAACDPAVQGKTFGAQRITVQIDNRKADVVKRNPVTGSTP